MPFYDYHCEACKETIEVFQSMNKDEDRLCNVCQGRMERLYTSNYSIKFEGNGFYETDYKQRHMNYDDL